MGFLDRLDKKRLEQARAKLTEAVDKHGDKIAGGIDKAARAADQRTGGKHHSKIAQASAKAKEGLSRLESDEKRRTDGGPTP